LQKLNARSTMTLRRCSWPIRESSIVYYAQRSVAELQ